MIKRYKILGYNEALSDDDSSSSATARSSRHYHYPVACKELSFILRDAYTKLPKLLRSSVFNDTLNAFRLLPLMKNQSAVSAAHVLLQSAEAALPKQKRNLAVTEFKKAMVAHKRNHNNKSHHDAAVVSEFPHDILLHIFSFLDAKSLVSAGLTCRWWHTAASDNRLWRILYSIFFGRDKDLSIEEHQNGQPGEGNKSQFNSCTYWKEAFKTAYAGNSSGKLSSQRAYCTKCSALVWIDSLRCCVRGEERPRNRYIFLASSKQVVDYLLDGSLSVIHSSDCDSESDEELIPGLWAYRSSPLTTGGTIFRNHFVL